uniref:Uncharacterized protein n=1 Tax=Oryza barthii TaxID=65489 RepID=A0A0D3FGQ8_9ORYZ
MANVFPDADGKNERCCWLKRSLCALVLFSASYFAYFSFFSGNNVVRDLRQCPFCEPSPPSPPVVTGAAARSPTTLAHIVFVIGASNATWAKRRAGREGDGEVRWLVMGDDDTVFFPENLVAVLDKYDHREMYYVGSTSESVGQNVVHSYSMAFGGGGYAISYPAAAALAGIMDGCLDRYNEFYGSDHRVQACLAELGVPLTTEPGFHQLDLKGHVYGLLAAHPVAPLVSLHHLDRLNPISPNWLKRLPATPLRTFRAWSGSPAGPFTVNTRPEATPNATALPCHRKPIMFYLDRVTAMSTPTTNWTLTEYVPEVLSGERCNTTGFDAATKVQMIQVIALKMDPTIWKRAPRRQCCKVQNANEGDKLIVKIHECKPDEATTSV